MKRSVSFMNCSIAREQVAKPIALHVVWLPLIVLRLRFEREGRRQPVVDDHRLAVAQLESTGAHHGFIAFQAGDHGNEIAALLAEADELLAQHLAGLPVFSSWCSSMTYTESP